MIVYKRLEETILKYKQLSLIIMPHLNVPTIASILVYFPSFFLMHTQLDGIF